MRRLLFTILVVLCWFIMPIYAETYRVNGSATYGVSQSPTMNMRSTSPYSTNSYSMYYSVNDGMHELGIQSYSPMNMNGNNIYCPGSAIQGIAPDENTENNISSHGHRRATTSTPEVDLYGHKLLPNGDDTWTCSKCGKTYTTTEILGVLPWCEVPLEFDWKVIAFMAGLLAVYAYIKKTNLTSNSDVRNGRDMLA